MNTISIPILMSVTLPVLLAVLGFVLARRVERLDTRSIAVLVFYVFIPFLLFRQGLSQSVHEHQFVMLLFFTLFHTGALYFLVSQILYLFNISQRLRYLYLLNVLVVSLFSLRSIQPFLGEPAQAVQTIQILIFFHMVILAILGVYLSYESTNFLDHFLAIIKTPLLYALIAGVLFSAIQLELPFEIMSVVDSLTNTSTHLAVVLAGLVIGKYIFFLQYKEYAILMPAIIFCVAARLILSPALAWVLTVLMNFDDAALQRAVILASGAPTGALAVVLVCVYGKINEMRFTALAVFASSVSSYLSLPLLHFILNTWLPVSS